MSIKECLSPEDIASAADTMFQLGRGLCVGDVAEKALRASQILISAGPTVVLELCRKSKTYLSPAYWARQEDLVVAGILLSQSLRGGNSRELLLVLQQGVPEYQIKDLAHTLKDKFPGFDFRERFLLFGFAGSNLVRAYKDGNWLNSQILNSKV